MAGFLRLIPRFLLVSEGQYRNHITGAVVVVQGYISGIAKADYELTPLRNIGEWPSDLRQSLQQQELPVNGLTRTVANLGILFKQKVTAAF